MRKAIGVVLGSAILSVVAAKGGDESCGITDYENNDYSSHYKRGGKQGVLSSSRVGEDCGECGKHAKWAEAESNKNCGCAKNTDLTVGDVQKRDYTVHKPGYDLGNEEFDKTYHGVGKGWEKNDDNCSEQDADHEEHQKGSFKEGFDFNEFKNDDKEHDEDFCKHDNEVQNGYKKKSGLDKGFQLGGQDKKSFKELDKQDRNQSTEVDQRLKQHESDVDVEVEKAHEDKSKEVEEEDRRDAREAKKSNFRRDQVKRNEDVKSKTNKEAQHECATTVNNEENAQCKNAQRADHHNEENHFDLSKDNSKRHHCEYNEQKHQDAGIRQGLISEECVELKEHVHAKKHCKYEHVEKKRWLKKNAHKKSFREKHGLNKHAKCIKNKAANNDKFGVLKKDANCKKQNAAAAENTQVKICKRADNIKETSDDETDNTDKSDNTVDNAEYEDAAIAQAQSLNNKRSNEQNDQQTKKFKNNVHQDDSDDTKNVRVRDNSNHKEEDCGCEDN